MCVLISFHVRVDFPAFLLLLMSSFIILWSEKIAGVISILNLLKFVLHSIIQSILEHVLCVLEKKVDFAAFWWNIPYVSVKYIWFNVQLSPNVSLLIFCLDAPSIADSGVLNHHYYCNIVYFSLQICWYLLNIFRWSDVWCVFIYNCYIFLTPSSLYNDLLCLLLPFSARSLFVWYSRATPALLLVSIYIEFLLISLHFEPMCVSWELKWASFRQHIVVFCFDIHASTLCLLISVHLQLEWLLRSKNYYCHVICLPSGCFVSSLFLFFFPLFLLTCLSWWFSMVICSVSPFLCFPNVL